MLDVNLEGEDISIRKMEQKPQLKHISSLLREDVKAQSTRRKGRTFLFGPNDHFVPYIIKKSESAPVILSNQEPVQKLENESVILSNQEPVQKLDSESEM